MKPNDIVALRLMHQQLGEKCFSTIDEVIHQAGAIQAQDILQAKRALGSRVSGSTEATINQAIADKKIIRTRPMRGTLHYMDPDIVHPFLDLCASKTLPGFKRRREFLGIEEKHAERALEIIESALRGGVVMTRTQISQLLKTAGIPMQTQRTYHLLCYAATKKLVCFGPSTENEETFVLLDDRVGRSSTMSDEEGLALIACVYFQSHGLATVQDFAGRTGLSMGEAKRGIAGVGKAVESLKTDDTLYYRLPGETPTKKVPEVLLLAGFDEYVLGYKDRSLLGKPDHIKNTFSKNGIFFPTIIYNGTVVGLRKRTMKKEHVEIVCSRFDDKPKGIDAGLEQQSTQFAAFRGKKEVKLR